MSCIYKYVNKNVKGTNYIEKFLIHKNNTYSEDNDDFGDIEVMVVVEVNVMIGVALVNIEIDVVENVVVDEELVEMIHMIIIQMLNILDIMKL